MEFKIKNPEIETKFNIGIFQFEDYLAFYINLTAYNEHINSRESTNDTCYLENPDDTTVLFFYSKGVIQVVILDFVQIG